MPRIDVVGLGPAGPELMSAGTLALSEQITHRYLRTARHPTADQVPDATTFDRLYDGHDTFDEVYAAIIAELIVSASRYGRVLYAVPGSPMVAERTVELLIAQGAEREDLEVVIHPAMSFMDLAWVRLGVDPVGCGATILDAHRFATARTVDFAPALVAQCDSRFVLSDIKLAVDPAPAAPVSLLWHLGLPDERIVVVGWEDIDRTLEPDHLCCLWVPGDAP